MKLTLKTSLLLCSLLSISILSFSQIPNYTAIRDSVKVIKCGVNTRADHLQTRMNLESLTVDASTKGVADYYYDLGMCYLVLSAGGDKDEQGLRTAIRHFERSIEYKKKFSPTYWNITFIYALMNDCENSAKYLAAYKKYAKRKEWKDIKSQVELLSISCSELGNLTSK